MVRSRLLLTYARSRQLLRDSHVYFIASATAAIAKAQMTNATSGAAQLTANPESASTTLDCFKQAARTNAIGLTMFYESE